MKEHNCENCKRRAKYDNNPTSLGGRFWRWHINWCPGWKGYMNSLGEDQKIQIQNKYQLK